jgi:hypothetical protein
MAKKLSPFEQAFADARSSGEKTFPFNGKTYSTTTMDDVQKKVDAMPSMSRTTGVTVTTQGATYPKAYKTSNDDNGPNEMVKGFRAAREKFGDTPFVDALMNAGKVGIAMEGGKLLGPAGRAIGTVAKKVFGDKTSAAPKDMDPPLFKSSTKPEKSGFEEAYPRDFKKGGRISLKDCKVSTCAPSKKNPNF